MKPVLLSLIALLFLGSCSVQQQFTFKKDFSGSSEVLFDMEAVVGMMKTDSTAGSDSLAMVKQGLSSFNDQLKTMPEQIPLPPQAAGWGISNAKFKKQGEGKFSITFDFKNLDGLNKYLQNGIAGNDSSAATRPKIDYFSAKGKTFTYHIPNLSGVAGLPNMGGASMGDLSKLMTYKTTLNFEKTIRKVTVDNLEVTSDKHTVSFTLKDLASEKPSKLTILLK